MLDYERLEEYDKNKTKVLKYVIYKKRTENEIKRKFEKDIEPDMLEEIIQELKENNYISDSQYIERSSKRIYGTTKFIIKTNKI